MSATEFVRLVRGNLRRAVFVSALVGTLLVLINHGDHLADEPTCDRFWFKAVLCYLVPFMVSLVSGIAATRGAAPDRQ